MVSKCNIGEGLRRFKVVILIAIAIIACLLGVILSVLVAPLLAIASISCGALLLLYLVMRWILRGFKKERDKR